MKNLTILFSLLLSTIYFNVEAQDVGSPLSRGSFMIGSGIGLSASTSDIETSSTSRVNEAPRTVSSLFNFTPKIGYFVTDNFVVGIGADILASRTETSSDQEGDISDTRTLFGPYLRYYIPFGQNQAIYLGAVSGFGGSTSSQTINGNEQTIDNSIVLLSVGPGYTIFANSNIALETQLLYSFGMSTSDIDVNGVTTETETTTNAFDISVGVNYYFNR